MDEFVECDWKKRGVGRPRVPENYVLMWKKRRREGWTYRAIAEEFNVAEITVQRHLNGYYDDKEKVLKGKT